ncbi:MAG: Hsp20/alpha crystallin family protein [Anaerolineae bacterium]|nr:Hsp20/alpha crystallin family protein [Anaerolineae bacterium]
MTMRWNPVRDLIQMRDMMDQLANESMGRGREGRNGGATWRLPVDAYSTEEAIVLIADVPGLTPDDVSVTLEGDTLTLSGEFKGEQNAPNFLLRERPVGRFERTLTVNTPIDPNKLEATVEYGVLRVTLPKAEAVKPRQIAVKAGSR